MPTNQINNAADEPLPEDARDDRTAAAAVTDEGLDQPPGGGGLGGASAGGQGAAAAGTAPGSPIDVPLPTSATDAGAAPSAYAQARREAVDQAPDEGHPSSR